MTHQYMRRLTWVALVALWAVPASAQEVDTPPGYADGVTNAGTSAAAFLQIGVGARAQAMGNAGTTMIDDATAMFWNPASVARLGGTAHLAFDHTEWLADTQLDYMGAVFPLSPNSAVGLSVLSFQMIDNQPVRTVDQPEGTGEFYSASDLSLGLTYGVALTDRFAAGLTGKYVHEGLWNEDASAFAVDLGVRYRTTLPGLNLAASISNFGGDMQLDGRDLLRPYDDDPGNSSNDQLNARLDTDSFSLPLYFRFGVGYEQTFGDMHRFVIATDLLHPSDNSEAINIGGEYTFWDTFSVRGGAIALFEEDRVGGAPSARASSAACSAASTSPPTTRTPSGACSTTPTASPSASAANLSFPSRSSTPRPMTKWYALLLAFAFSTAHAQSPKLIINEFLADPSTDDASTTDVIEGDANGDGTRDAQADEFVEMLNVSRDTLDLTGWRLGDDERVNFTFPDGYRLPPQHFVVVFGGGDVTAVPGYDADPLQTRVFAPGDSVGNGLANGGETIVLLSPDGSMDTYVSYGSRVGAGAPTGGELASVTFEVAMDVSAAAGENVAVTRNPDGDVYASDPWVKHTDVRTTSFSPGTTLDGDEVAQRVSPPMTIVFNEILADPSTDPVLGDANGDGERSSSGDEFVELANVSDEPVDLSGWTLGDDEANVTFTFPAGYVLPARGIVTVFGGGDVSNVPGYNADPLQTRAFVADSTFLGGIGNGLSNSGDIIMLLSPDGSYDSYLAYGSLANTGGPAEGKYPEGVEFEVEINTAANAGGDNSITRFPDGNVNTSDPFVQHLTVSSAPFSPGTTVTGAFTLPAPQPPVTVVINEVLADATTDANGDGTVDAAQDQFIELVNVSETTPVDLSGFSVGDASGTTFTFPDGYRLAPLSFVAVFGGGDVSNVPGYNADASMTRAFAASGTLGDGLSASGDVAVLLSPDGAYDAYVAFGSEAGAGDPAGTTWEFPQSTVAIATMASSITRDPDGTILELDPFVVHSDVSDLIYSPAQTSNGLSRLGDFVDVPHPWGTGEALAYEAFERDRVEIREAPQLLPLSLPRGTIEMWFKPDSVITATTHPPDWTYLFTKNLSGNQPGDLGIGFPRGEGRIDFFMQDGTTTSSTFTSEDVNETFYPRWYHLAGTWNTDEGVMRLFLDGKLVDEEPSTIPLLGGTQQIAIGGGNEDLWNSRFESFRGQIDEVRFSVIDRYTEDFELATAPFEPDQYTLALWHFDEGEGDTAADATGNGFTGTLGGFDAEGNPDPASAPEWVNLSLVVGIDDDSEVGEAFSLDQNFPNPVGSMTTIRFNVPEPSEVALHLYNVLGQRIVTLADGVVEAGTHTLRFDASTLASGVYFYVLESDDVSLVKRMMVVR